MKAIEFLLDSARGTYIPRDFVETFDVTKWGMIPELWAVQTCVNPDDECYWDAWNEILDRAEYREGGNVWHLHHDGDLFAYCLELMTDEEKQNLGFED